MAKSEYELIKDKLDKAKQDLLTATAIYDSEQDLDTYKEYERCLLEYRKLQVQFQNNRKEGISDLDTEKLKEEYKLAYKELEDAKLNYLSNRNDENLRIYDIKQARFEDVESLVKEFIDKKENRLGEKDMKTEDKKDILKTYTDELKETFGAFAKKHFGKKKREEDPEKWNFETTNSQQEVFNKNPDTKIKKSKLNLVLRSIMFCVYFAIGCLVFLNVRPYINIIIWMGQNFNELGISKLILSIPPLGFLFNAWAALTAFLAGFFLWGLLQGLQMLPVIIQDQPEALLSLMNWMSKFKSIKIKENDSSILIELKQKFNSIPYQWLEDSKVARSWAYTVDFILCFACYPPIVGGYERADIVLLNFQFNDIDFQNVVTSLFAMLGVEILYQIYKLINGAIDLFIYSSGKETLS